MSFRKERKIITDDYLTDPQLIKELGPFNTDPCCLDKMPCRIVTGKLITSQSPNTAYTEP